MKRSAALLLSLLMAACGGSGGNSTASSSTPVPATTNAAGTDTNNNATPPTTPTTPTTTTTAPPASSGTSGGTSSNDTTTGNTSPPTSNGNNSTPPATGNGGSNASSGTSSSTSTSTSQSGDAGSATQAAFKVDESARFTDPSDLALDGSGNLYVMDRSDRTIRRVAPTGEVSQVSGGWDAGSRIASDATGNLFVLSGTDIWKLTPNGSATPDKVVYAAYPQSPGSYHPVQIAPDAAGRLYVLQQYRNEFYVERIDADRLVHTHPYTYSEIGSTFDMAADALGNLALGRIGPTGAGSVTLVPQTLQPATDTTVGLVKLAVPLNSYGKIVLDGSGNTYIADMTTSTSSDNKTVATGMRVIKLAQDGTVTTLLSDFPSGQNGLLRLLPTAYHTNIGLAVGKGGEVYVSMPTDQAIYKISSPGVATLYAGKPAQPGVTVSP